MKDENDTQTKELDLHPFRSIIGNVAKDIEITLQKFIKDEVTKQLKGNLGNFEDELDKVINLDALKRLLEESQYSEFVTTDSLMDELQNNDIPTRDEIVDPDQIDETVERAIENYFDVNQFVLKKGGK